VRERILAEGHRRARWRVPESLAQQAHLRLEALRLVPNEEEPVLAAMALAAPPPPGPPEVEARPVQTLEEYRAGIEIELEAFALDASLHEESRAVAERHYEEEHVAGQAPRFLAFLAGEPVATATAITGAHGLFLSGGATSPHARGRGAYRALVRARWDFAAARGTPGLVVEAGRHSRPILERLGFETVAQTCLYDDTAI
jgi:GNAT superfamily N-acetyltransferase